MTAYRKKPVIIEAVQWHAGDGKSLLRQFTNLDIEYGFDHNGGWALIPTLEGYMTARDGDFIIRGIQGEFYPCKPDIFEATYEEVR